MHLWAICRIRTRATHLPGCSRTTVPLPLARKIYSY